MQNPFEQLRILQPGAEHCFEEVVSQILRQTTQDAHRVRLHRGDEGVDTFTGTWGEGGSLDVFQIKYFTGKWGDSQKDQIRTAYIRASENTNYNLNQWILVVPTNPTAADYKWFHEWADKQSGSIEIIDGAELTERLSRHECGAARQLLKGWGVLGLSGSPSLVPSLTAISTDLFKVMFRLRLENTGDKTARLVRLKVAHSETSTAASGASEDWWKDIGNGPVNPRNLELVKPLNPGENIPIMAIPFRELPIEKITISIRITGEDLSPVEAFVVISPDDINQGRPHLFTFSSSLGNLTNPQIAEASPQQSQAARELLEMLFKLPDLLEPALHVILRPFPGNPTQTGFFIAEVTAPGGSAYGIRTALLNGAVRELLDSGRILEPVESSGRLVYEFVK